MTVSDILRPEAARILSNVSSKKRLMQVLAETAGEVYGVCPNAAFDALQEREQLGHTGVGRGVALPHARLQGLDAVYGVFLRLDRAVDFDAIDRQPVDLVFGLFAPEHRGVEHLKALALIARTMRDPGMRAKLRGNADPGTLYAVLTEHEASAAA
jgi:PTS system nitrogen regulatory IIA component